MSRIKSNQHTGGFFALTKFKVMVPVLALLVAGCSSEPDLPQPEMNRFTPVVLGGAGALDEPMAFDVAEDGRVYVVERKGGFKVYNPLTDAFKEIATIDVNLVYTNYEGQEGRAEEGLVGFTLDPDFEQNNWVYMLYADPDEAKHNLSRFELINEELIRDSETILLDFPVQRNYCCHTGGGMDWDADGNLYVTIGNNTQNTIGAQTDERPGRDYRDDQRGAANTNDLRGGIIRIHPEDDGTYSIPEGNLFEPGTPGTRPEIYVMGTRNAWRVSVDSETGWIYWGEVGPDAREDSEIGPMGYDEFNQAKGPGFFGWPYFIADNRAYPFADFVSDSTVTYREPKDPSAPTNTSPNNTGLEQLPPAQPALIYYPYAASEDFPLVGSGSRSSTGGRVYHRADYAADAERPFPEYYEDKLFLTDLAREWIMVVTLDENGNYESMERFLPDYHPVEPIDMDFGPEGDLYVLEYGSNWFQYSPNSKLVRIEYNAGNRPPNVMVASSSKGGEVPFDVNLSSEGTVDYDGDELSYLWEISRSDGSVLQTYSTPDASVYLEEPGSYTATLTVTDAAGLSGSSSTTLVAGNAAPEVSMQVEGGNRTFFFPGQTVNYSVSVSDAENGSLADGGIPAEDVVISIDYASAGFDFKGAAAGDGEVDVSTPFFVARKLIESSDCFTCHQVTTASAGPAYTDVAERYAGDQDAPEYLADKIMNGGSGVWGEISMAAHPEMSRSDALEIAEYILSIGDESWVSLPSSGSYTLNIPEGDEDGAGGFIFRAAYSDGGTQGLPAIANEDIVVLRSPLVGVGAADLYHNITIENPRGRGEIIQPKDGSYIGFQDIDLTGIRQLVLDAGASSRSGEIGGDIEIRLGSPSGELLGRGEVASPTGGGFGGGGGPVVVPVGSGITGLQDIYIVFSNENARAELDPLMSLSSIRFMNEEGPVE